MLTLGQAGLVLIGGGLGSAARYGAMRLATRFELHASSALVAINLVGCFLAGATAQMFVGGAPGIETDVAKFLVLGGVLGGFTTFSAVALECATAAGPRRRRIFINAALSVVLAAPLARLGMIVVGGGFVITRVPPVALVAVGGALGSLARVAIVDACATRLDPWITTTAINLAGSMAAGFIWMRLAAQHDGPGRTNRLAWSALLITGFMGGFTTFSGFGLFTSGLAGASRLNAAITNLWVSLVIAIFGAFAGAMLAKPALRRPNP